MDPLVNWALELIRKTSTDLSPDVERWLRRAREEEAEGGTAWNVLDAMIRNVEMSREAGTPICQDTGLTTFFVQVPRGTDPEAIREALQQAIRLATEEGSLRPNSVHPITGKNTGDNLGVDLPHIEFEPSPDDGLVIDLLLKGGGSENTGAQYRLPDAGLKAGRDLEGVYRCVVDAVHQAQGHGCAPGILGVCIGGDRAGGYAGAKRQLLRPLDDTNPDPALAELEERLIRDCNRLGVGPMGFGGRTTVLSVKVGWKHRHPASFFVSIAYSCWADRHRRLEVRNGVGKVF